MMGVLTAEVMTVQNPALGAALLWRFASAFPQPATRYAPVQLMFLPLPILFRQEYVEVVTGTGAATGVRRASGLRAFADGLREFKTAKTDLLLSLQNSVLQLRELSLESLSLAIAAHLVTIDSEGMVLPIPRDDPRRTPNRVRRLLRGADKLGYWCGAVTLFELAATLHLRF
jgi:hypothetical protein